MTFTTPLGLLALLAIPAIVVIHLFRRRFPVRPVAGLFLWQLARQMPEGGGRIARLPITWSLILECLAALALALILAGARLFPTGVSAHLVVLLDDSASMAATSPGGGSARDRAAGRVLAELARLGDRARVTLVRSGERPAVLLGPAALAVETKAALGAWRPESPHHSLALGLRLARELAGRTGRVLVVSDALPPPGSEQSFEGGLWAAVGEAPPNVGITAAQRTISSADQRGVVSLTLANHAGAAARQRVHVAAADKAILVRAVEIPPGTSSLALPIPAGLPAVRVTLDQDALLRDNDVMLAEPRPQIVAVENRLPDGRGRQALARALDALSGVTRAGSGHLSFGAAADLDQPAVPGVWRVGFGRPPAAWVGVGDEKDFIGPFVLEKRHPLLLGLSLGGVVWAGATPVRADAARPLISAGDRTLAGIAAPLAGVRTDPVVLFNLDLERTNLIRAPDWPIMISNVVEMRRQSLPGPERWNYRVGEWIRVRLGREPTGPLRQRCGAVERPLPPGRLLEFLAPSACGLLQILEGDQVLFELGVNFLDDVETDLRRQASADVGRLTDVPGLRAESGPASDPLFWTLLAIAGGAILANWCLVSPGLGRA